MRFVAWLTALALSSATAAHGMRMQVQDPRDEFDETWLRIEEANYLRRAVPDVPVVTDGGERRLLDLMSAKPTIVLLAYFSCGHTCPVTIRNLARLRMDADVADYRVLVLSFDANDTLATLRGTVATLGDVPGNWAFGLLSEASSQLLTEAVGFRYFFSERDQTFVHPAVLVFLSPTGEVMRYLYGADPRADDVELALIESRNRTPRVNEIVDLIRLTCFQFDASRSRYVLHPTIMFGSAGFGVLALVGIAALATRRTSKGGQ